MTTHGQAVPTQQQCPTCNALVYYEGHSELRSNLVPHRFHCHSCGGIFLVRSTSHKPPRFRITGRHAVAAGGAEMDTAEAIAHAGQDHDHGAADELADDEDESHDHDHDHDHEAEIEAEAPGETAAADADDTAARSKE